MGTYHFCRRAAPKLDTARDHGLHNRGAARDIDDLHIEAMFFKHTAFLGKMIHFLAGAHAAISEDGFPSSGL